MPTISNKKNSTPTDTRESLSDDAFFGSSKPPKVVRQAERFGKVGDESSTAVRYDAGKPPHRTGTRRPGK